MGAGLESGQSRDAPGFQLLKPIRQGRASVQIFGTRDRCALTLAVEMQRLDLQQWGVLGRPRRTAAGQERSIDSIGEIGNN